MKSLTNRITESFITEASAKTVWIEFDKDEVKSVEKILKSNFPKLRYQLFNEKFVFDTKDIEQVVAVTKVLDAQPIYYDASERLMLHLIPKR